MTSSLDNNDSNHNRNNSNTAQQQQQSQPPAQPDPMELLLRQELEREVEAAWKAYEALAQLAWDNNDGEESAQQVTPVAFAASPSSRRNSSSVSHRRPAQRGGHAPEDPIVLE